MSFKGVLNCIPNLMTLGFIHDKDINVGNTRAEMEAENKLIRAKVERDLKIWNEYYEQEYIYSIPNWKFILMLIGFLICAIYYLACLCAVIRVLFFVITGI